MVNMRGIESPDWPAWGAEGISLGDWLHLVAGRSMFALKIVVLLAIAWFIPNSHQLMGRFSPAFEPGPENPPVALTWRPSLR
jgi:hypothetical protein